MLDTIPTDEITAPTDAAPSAAERARSLIEQQLAMLTRLADMGLNIAARVEQQALAEADAQPPRNWGIAYARIARSVRMTIALQSKVLKDLAALEDEAGRRTKAGREEADQALTARKTRVWRIVERVACERFSEDESENDRTDDLAGHRYGTYALLDRDICGDILERPLGALVETICQGLGLDPDWEAQASRERASQSGSSPRP